MKKCKTGGQSNSNKKVTAITKPKGKVGGTNKKAVVSPKKGK